MQLMQETESVQKDSVQLLMTVGEVADMLECSAPMVRRMVHSGELRAIRVGRGMRFRREWVLSFLESAKPWRV
jgi:excisionase family DNA binding protein